ncbi:MAG: hypothetical protein EAY75_08765 [Bacteroidetes bacterium]|nr:MAG: hypothetical protein EAY75_08765 [Bacteroidota bacterium]
MTLLLPWMFLLLHPFYVSVVSINQNTVEKSLEVSVRIFTEDLEQTLRMQNPTETVDLIKLTNGPKMDSLISRYIRLKLQLQTGNRSLHLQYVGFERIEESVWCYFEVVNVPTIKQLRIKNSMLYEFKKEQFNMHHVAIGGQRKSYKLSNPENQFELNFQ